MAQKNLNLFGTYLRSGRSAHSAHRRNAKRSLVQILTRQAEPVRYGDLWKLAYQAGIDEVAFSSSLRDLRRQNVVTFTATAASAENPMVSLTPALRSVAAIL
jgi:hypothetical protein